MTDYVTKDSGQREEFGSGAVRDVRQGKGRYDLISFLALSRIAGVYERGAAKYDDRNWEKGMPIGRTLDSALRHIGQYITGEDDEDHLAQAAWNLIAALHFDEGIKRGYYPSELDDRPHYSVDVNSNRVHRIVTPHDRQELTEAEKGYLTQPVPEAVGTYFIEEEHEDHEGEVYRQIKAEVEGWIKGRKLVPHDPLHPEDEGQYHIHLAGKTYEATPVDDMSYSHTHMPEREANVASSHA